MDRFEPHQNSTQFDAENTPYAKSIYIVVTPFFSLKLKTMSYFGEVQGTTFVLQKQTTLQQRLLSAISSGNAVMQVRFQIFKMNCGMLFLKNL